MNLYCSPAVVEAWVDEALALDAALPLPLLVPRLVTVSHALSFMDCSSASFWACDAERDDLSTD